MSVCEHLEFVNLMSTVYCVIVVVAMATCFTISLMFLLMTADVDGQQDWEVKYNPSYVCALRGSTVRMFCIYPPGYWITSSHWSKTTHRPYSVSPNLCPDTYYRQKVQCHSNSITLTHVTEADKGVYYCRFTASTHYGVWRGTPGVRLDVTDLQVETQQRVKEGDSVTLTCKTTCRLTEETTFIWYRNTQTLTEHTVNEFHLKSVSRHDSGLYRCAIRGHELFASSDVYLSVEYSPWNVSVSISSSGVIVEGDSVNLICSSESNPPVHIYSWFKENQTPSVGSGQTFSITNINSSLSGWFYCVAQNKHGSQRSAAVSLTVKVSANQREASVSADADDVQYTSVQYMINKDVMNEDKEDECQYMNFKMNPTSDPHRNIWTTADPPLKVRPFTIIDWFRSRYGPNVCLLLNHIDTFRLEYDYVDGQQDWEVKYNPSYVCALRGSTVRMSCIYPPDYWITSSYWSKTTHRPDSVSPNLCSDTYYRGKVQCHTNSITLTHVTEADKGVYYCRFISGYSGEWRGTPGVQLDVTDLQVETQQRVKEGDSVTLTCKTTCRLTEETTFIWYRNTQTLTEHKVNEFHLQSVSHQDSGVYRCAIRGSEHLSSPGVNLLVENVSGQQDWGVKYNPSYVCALRGSTVRMSCDLKYPSGHVVNNAFWTKAVYTGEENPNLCLEPTDRRRDCHSENKDSHSVKKDSYSITLTNVTEADKHVYYCRFTTNHQDGKWTGVPGAQLDVTEKFVGSGNIYRITNITSDHSGEYKCKANNKHGEKYSEAVKLNVMYAPRNVSVSISSSGVIVEGDSVNLTCSSESNPPVQNYSWFKENQTPSVGSGQTFSITNINSSLSGWFYLSANQREASVSADDVQYASVHHIRKKEISEKEQEECQYMNFKLNPTCDPDRLQLLRFHMFAVRHVLKIIFIYFPVLTNSNKPTYKYDDCDQTTNGIQPDVYKSLIKNRFWSLERNT
ncbi:B-cell receptor CD22 B-lymphocyte cell adhesion molecule [Triplophysa tibetana]|uniref:B-cell receptor CD22 B-lymphocyte cell adhesion molecule n=1 Tax=Triplophysa tibetana TaxID=1572043 RepID=A0A5A9PKV7_9TELE|nr:B-cell receptor CD22 B-lymphocyte cell adhesion molecule [Triplophysa tibetana]